MLPSERHLILALLLLVGGLCLADDFLALGTLARRAETPVCGSVHEWPDPKGSAQLSSDVRLLRLKHHSQREATDFATD